MTNTEILTKILEILDGVTLEGDLDDKDIEKILIHIFSLPRPWAVDLKIFKMETIKIMEFLDSLPNKEWDAVTADEVDDILIKIFTLKKEITS